MNYHLKSGSGSFSFNPVNPERSRVMVGMCFTFLESERISCFLTQFGMSSCDGVLRKFF